MGDSTIYWGAITMLNLGLILEYTLLGILFWYVYLRQKPIYRVKGDSWGTYPEVGDTFDAGGNDQPQQVSTPKSENLIVPIRIKQSRRNGWIIADKEKQALQELKIVDLETTSANPRQAA